jgi:L-serine deaminase
MANTRKAAESTTANAFETTLSSQLGASDLTINVASTTGLATPCYIVVEPDSATQREYIFIDSTVAATSFTTTTADNRYLSGSAAGSGLTHPSGSKVRVAPMKQHFEDIFDALGKVVDTTYSSGTAGEVKFDVSAATVDVANDEIAIIDANDSNKVKKESVADLVSGIAGTGVTASSGQLNVSVDTTAIAAGTLVTESETITSNDNDTTIPTSAAVKNYVDEETATLTNKTLKDYAETDQAVTSSSGVVSINLANGNTGSITLSENITDIDFTNVPTDGTSTFTVKVTQDGTGSRTMAINAITVNGGGDVTGLTAGAAGLTLSTGANDVDLVTFLFFDAGTPLINALLDFS